tara:strand:+ start:1386 stop:1628 length:243 start_codon:yes stop_codon:yes gene_type:complete
MNGNNSINNTTSHIAGLSTLVCLEETDECFDIGLVSSSGKVDGPPRSRLAGIVGNDYNEPVPESWISLHRRANPLAQEVQ